jgi:hypothetical protein
MFKERELKTKEFILLMWHLPSSHQKWGSVSSPLFFFGGQW